MRPVTRAILAGALLLAASCGSIPEPDRRPAGAARPGRAVSARDPGAAQGSITGRVLADDTGKPVRHAEISASADSGLAQRTLSNADGRFLLRDLPPGRYQLSCSRPGFVPIDLGQPRPFTTGRELEITGGASVDGVEFRLKRGAVVTGRVIDENGEPLVRATVDLVRWGYTQGRRGLRPVPWASGVTDDLGRYRLFGLPPGEFLLRVAPFAAAVDMDGGVRVFYVPAYWPGTADLNAAERLTLTSGTEITDRDFVLRPTPAVRISGTVVTSAGTPPAVGDVTLFQLADGRYDRPAQGLDTSRLARDGSFTVIGVAPGRYLVQVQTTDLTGNRGARPGGFQPSGGYEYALVPITVSDMSLDGIRVVTSPGATARGRVIFDQGAQPRFGPNSLPLTAPPVGLPASRMNAQSARARVHTDWTFDFAGLFGPRVFRVADLPGWVLKSVRHNGADTTDTPIEFKGNESASGLEVVLSNRITELTGTVRDDAGRDVADYALIVFAEDASRWRAIQIPGQPGPTSQPSALQPFGAASRFVRVGRPNQQGRFRIAGLPAARYLAVAVASIEEGAWDDPVLLERFRSSATAFDLAEGERKEITVPLLRADL